MRVDLLATDDRAWLALLEAVPHDFYHLPSYVSMAAAQEGGTARGLLVEEADRAMFLPLIVRDVAESDGARDAISPYGYPGPLFRGELDDAFVLRASAALKARLREENVVSLFVRLHPLLNREVRPLQAAGTIVAHGETVSIDLDRTAAEIWSDTQSGHRNEINRSIRAGHRAYLDDAWTHEADFVRIYRETMTRRGASPYYMFGRDYVRALRAALGPRLHLCVVEIDGVVAAAGLFAETCGIVQYHLSGTDDAFARERPTKLMLHYVRGVMKERNNRVMHLGGGLGAAADSLFKFKAGFSKQRQPFETWRVVVDADRYADLVRARDSTAEPTDARGFFPAYRRPLSPPAGAPS
jgi:hypothetical protein